MVRELKISITVKLKSKHEKIEKTATGYVVYVKEPPIENKANQAVIKLLAKHFGVPQSKISIVAGGHSKHKVVEIKNSSA
jgi:uncharacterized protein (TIGR00251 family)